LHVDKNDWYGGAEAAFSLDEVKDWTKTIGESHSSLHSSLYFDDASIERPEPISDQGHGPKLSFSRAYNLALAPQVIYTSARLLDVLVSSKSHKQLEFLAMGSWWVYSKHDTAQNEPSSSVENEQDVKASEASAASSSKLLRIPTNREDVAFSDSSIDLRAKRSLMKILRFILNFEEQREIWDPYRDSSFSDFLSLHFKLPPTLQPLLIALTLTPFPPSRTTTAYALPRIARHLRSTGKLGPGFSSVIPRWGGVSEIIQVACRAAAVGGATYALDRGINSDADAVWADAGKETATSRTLERVQVGLVGDGIVKASWIVGGEDDMTAFRETTEHEEEERPSNETLSAVTKTIAVVSSPLKSLFPVVEGSQVPAGAIVVFPTGSLTISDPELKSDETPPVYLIIHSSDTGECPAGQSKLNCIPLGSRMMINCKISLSTLSATSLLIKRNKLMRILPSYLPNVKIPSSKSRLMLFRCAICLNCTVEKSREASAQVGSGGAASYRWRFQATFCPLECTI